MADCNETLRELYHYLDGELTDDDRGPHPAAPRRLPPCLEAFDFEAELRIVITQPVRRPGARRAAGPHRAGARAPSRRPAPSTRRLSGPPASRP